MRKSVHFLIIAAALGMAASLLRALELETVFDPLTGLAYKNAAVTSALFVLTVFVSGLFVVFAVRLWHPSYTEIQKARAPSSSEKILNSSAAFIIIISGCAAFILNSEKAVSNSILALFEVFTGISIFVILFSDKEEGRKGESGVFALVPVFFLCYRLITMYAERSSDPVILHYVYDMLAIISVLLYFYYWASFMLRGSRPQKSVFFGLLGIYFTFIAAVAPLIVFFRTGTVSVSKIPDILCHLGIGLFVAGTLKGAARPRSAYDFLRGERTE